MKWEAVTRVNVNIALSWNKTSWSLAHRSLRNAGTYLQELHDDTSQNNGIFPSLVYKSGEFTKRDMRQGGNHELLAVKYLSGRGRSCFEIIY